MCDITHIYCHSVSLILACPVKPNIDLVIYSPSIGSGFQESGCGQKASTPAEFQKPLPLGPESLAQVSPATLQSSWK